VIDINAYLFIAVAVTSLFSGYLLIVVLVIYSLLKMAAKKGGVPEAEVIQNRPFMRDDRYGHFRTEWTSQKDFISCRPNCWIFNIFAKIMEKSVFSA